jgi:hydroxymethylpyrimidine pyrophosphatase-like HAD family hydrolase
MTRLKRFFAIACDADGTLTWRHRLALRTAGALVRWREAGGKVILVTGEIRDDLLHLARTGLFDRIVGENGGTLLRPPAWTAQALSEGATAELARLLRPRVSPLVVGQVLVGTQRPHESELRSAVRTLKLDYRVLFNRKNVMALPAGVSKAYGLSAALDDLGVPPARVVGIGDGENDVPMLRACGLGVAVANATHQAKSAADWVTRRRGPDGVMEVIRRLLDERDAAKKGLDSRLISIL